MDKHREYYVKEFDIELASSGEITQIQYFCNSENEPIYFPDRTLASLFHVNLSTLRGRFNRLTKKYQGYRLLISEKSKTRLSSFHTINWSKNPNAPPSNNNNTIPNNNNNQKILPIEYNNNNNNNNNNNSITGVSNYNAINNPIQQNQTPQQQSPQQSPIMSSPNLSNNSSPLHGLVALNHIKLVNVALAEWIANNHERLGTNISNIEENFKRSDIPYQRQGDKISIVVKNKEDLIPPYPCSDNFFQPYFPRQYTTSSPCSSIGSSNNNLLSSSGSSFSPSNSSSPTSSISNSSSNSSSSLLSCSAQTTPTSSAAQPYPFLTNQNQNNNNNHNNSISPLIYSQSQSTYPSPLLTHSSFLNNPNNDQFSYTQSNRPIFNQSSSSTTSTSPTSSSTPLNNQQLLPYNQYYNYSICPGKQYFGSYKTEVNSSAVAPSSANHFNSFLKKNITNQQTSQQDSYVSPDIFSSESQYSYDSPNPTVPSSPMGSMYDDSDFETKLNENVLYKKIEDQNYSNLLKKQQNSVGNSYFNQTYSSNSNNSTQNVITSNIINTTSNKNIIASTKKRPYDTFSDDISNKNINYTNIPNSNLNSNNSKNDSYSPYKSSRLINSQGQSISSPTLTSQISSPSFTQYSQPQMYQTFKTISPSSSSSSLNDFNNDEDSFIDYNNSNNNIINNNGLNSNNPDKYLNSPKKPKANNNVCCFIEGGEPKTINLSNINNLNELRKELSNLFTLMSFSISFSHNSQHQQQEEAELDLGKENWNEFCGKIDRIYIRPFNITPEIRNLINC